MEVIFVLGACMADPRPTDIDTAREAVQQNDRMEFAKALNAKLFSAGIEDTEVSRSSMIIYKIPSPRP